ncbi:hypothetical protein Tco_0488978 [Tanacetum coccineum]
MNQGISLKATGSRNFLRCLALYSSLARSTFDLTKEAPFVHHTIDIYDSKLQQASVCKSVRYGVSKELDTAYWGLLGVGTTFDIFHNIHILYLQYGVLTSSGYGVLIFFPLWSLVSAVTDTSYLP